MSSALREPRNKELLARHSRVPSRYGNASANERELNHMSRGKPVLRLTCRGLDVFDGEKLISRHVDKPPCRPVAVSTGLRSALSNASSDTRRIWLFELTPACRHDNMPVGVHVDIPCTGADA